MDALLKNPAALGAIAVIVVALIAALVVFKKTSGEGTKKRVGRSESTDSGIKVRTAVVWFDSSEGPFAKAFEYQAKKGIKDDELRALVIEIVSVWDKKNKTAVVLVHPSGRETQLLKIKAANKVAGKPFLAIEYVSFTSDARRTGLFLEGCNVERIQCGETLFEAARKHFLSYKESKRLTCPKSSMGMRNSYVAPIETGM